MPVEALIRFCQDSPSKPAAMAAGRAWTSSGQQGIWSNDSHTTGSVTLDAGGDSGAVEAHFAPPAYTGFAPLDVKFTFTCPVPANRE